MRRAAPHAKVFLLPYGEDLSACFSATPETKSSDRIDFLFSGQLRERHNIDKILDALVLLGRARPGRFTFNFSGRGPEREIIDAYANRHPFLREVLLFEADFDTWAGRLEPFRRSHVLVYPCKHAGWGLVIPEAMAAGMPVITTRNAEAGRYFIRHRVNGIFVEPTSTDIFREMLWCVDNPTAVRAMGERARDAARDGDASTIGLQLAEILRQLPSSSRTTAKKAAHRMARLAHGALGR